MSDENFGTAIARGLVAALTHALPPRPNLSPYFEVQHLQAVVFSATTNTGSLYEVYLDAYGMPSFHEPHEHEFNGHYWTRPGMARLNGVVVMPDGFVGFDSVTGCLITGVIAHKGTKQERKVTLRRSSTVREVTFKSGA